MRLDRIRALTLVEVLVVVAIIAVLAAIIASATLHAVASTRSSSCMENLRQMHLGVEMYATDHDGYWPSYCFVSIAYDSRDGAKQFKAAIHKYTKSDDIFYCPSDANARRATDEWQLASEAETSYDENLGMLFRGTKLPGNKLAYLFNPQSILNPSGCRSIGDVVYSPQPQDRSVRMLSSHADRFNSVYLDGHTKNLPVYEGGRITQTGPCEGAIDRNPSSATGGRGEMSDGSTETGSS